MSLWLVCLIGALGIAVATWLALSAHWRLDALGHDQPTGRHHQRGEQ